MKFKTMKASNQYEEPEFEEYYKQWKKNKKIGSWEDFKEQYDKSIHPEKDFNTLEELETWAFENSVDPDPDSYCWNPGGRVVIDFDEKEIILYDWYMD